MASLLGWLENEVQAIPGALVTKVETDVNQAANSAITNIRTDAANAVNQYGASLTSGLAGKIAPAGQQPVTIPLSSGQVLFVAVALALLIGYAVVKATR